MMMGCNEIYLYPKVSLMVENYWLELLPEDYIIKNGESGCVLGFLPNQGAEYWILGDSFFRGYYTIHDDKMARIGVVPHSYSTKSELRWK
jgi:hypothetical protein